MGKHLGSTVTKQDKSSRPVWSAEQVPGRPGPQSELQNSLGYTETLSQNTNNKKKSEYYLLSLGHVPPSCVPLQVTAILLILFQKCAFFRATAPFSSCHCNSNKWRKMRTSAYPEAAAANSVSTQTSGFSFTSSFRNEFKGLERWLSS